MGALKQAPSQSPIEQSAQFDASLNSQKGGCVSNAKSSEPHIVTLHNKAAMFREIAANDLKPEIRDLHLDTAVLRGELRAASAEV
jgi:hypothetical protein